MSIILLIDVGNTRIKMGIINIQNNFSHISNNISNNVSNNVSNNILNNNILSINNNNKNNNTSSNSNNTSSHILKNNISNKEGYFEYVGAITTHISQEDTKIWNDFFTNKILLFNKIDRVIGVCVAGISIAHTIEKKLSSYIPCLRGVNSITWLTGQIKLQGLHNAYATPHTLGADRWLAMYSLLNMQQPIHNIPCVLATLGTATTIDVLYWNNNQAYFAGGIIIAGLKNSLESLASNTAQLPNISQWIDNKSFKQSLNTAIPNTTDSALFEGAIAAQIGAIQVLMAKTERLYGTPQLYLSGGAMSYIQDYFSYATVLQMPVLKGLAAYALL
jgi:type III pantothenate kinase